MGFTPASIVLDAPIVDRPGPGPAAVEARELHRATSSARARCALGLEMSRNLMTVRLAQAIGMDKIIDMAAPVRHRRAACGATSPRRWARTRSTLLELATAYAMLVNGGKQIEPALIERIQDRHGRPSCARDPRRCDGCQRRRLGRPAAAGAARHRASRSSIPRNAYQMVSMLEGVVERGTGQGRAGDRQAARRQDRHHQRQQGRLVRRLLARSGGRRLRRLRPAASHGRRGDRAPPRRCRSGSRSCRRR